jgi:hypothetical protein
MVPEVGLEPTRREAGDFEYIVLTKAFIFHVVTV